jgi:hypothetical protein
VEVRVFSTAPFFQPLVQRLSCFPYIKAQCAGALR